MSETNRDLIALICRGFSHLTENQKWFLLGFCERVSMETVAKEEHADVSGERPRRAAEG